MNIKCFISSLGSIGIDFFAGVPDSLLKPLCDWLNNTNCCKNITTQNEGGAVALAAGYHLATGRVPCVYMQNSGIGNAANPIISLTSPDVYGIPILYIVGWRGEPGVSDEPQHYFQGRITVDMLRLFEINTKIIDKNTTSSQLDKHLAEFAGLFSRGESAAILVRRNTFTSDCEKSYTNSFSLSREAAIEIIVENYPDALFVSTTGKISRELYEIRKRRGESQTRDFMTVGSMGHASLIALGIALNQPDRQIVCLDGDGAALMHMGALAVIGKEKPKNLVHILLNNEAHESVGGMPNASDGVDYCSVVRACDYHKTTSVKSEDELNVVLQMGDSLTFIEVKCSVGSRKNLGRPKESPKENKVKFI